jgi:ABC-type transporter Mla subunit MlaD
VSVLAAALAAVVLGTGAGGGGEGTRYRILFDNAFGVVEGADFKVKGVRAGEVVRFDLSKGFPPKALVEVEVAEPGLASFRADARCEIRPQSLIGEYFVDCDPGKSDQPLPEDTVQVDHTAGTIPLDLVNNILRQPQRERLPLIVNALGAGLAGRPQDLQEALRRAHPGLRETEQTLEILGRQQDIIERFVRDSDVVVDELNARRRDVVRFVREAGETAEVSASRREDIARTFDRLPTFLGELEPTMERLGELADAQLPVLRNVRRAAPDLDETFRRLAPFSRASRPALLSLGDLSRTASAALDESDEEIDELRELSENAPGFAKPLRQFLQTIDDRERSIEPDPRAANSAPPPPDKTANAEGKGFTGMEAIWNYAFWQTLALNPYDQVGHLLRFTGTVNDCSPYQAKPSPEQLEKCTSWLGPYQPGITAPDPTTGAAPAARERRASVRRTRAPERRERITGGEPEARPLPGRPDPSRPRLVLPQGIQELLDRLGAPSLPDTRPGGSSDRLLDYLLGP